MTHRIRYSCSVTILAGLFATVSAPAQEEMASTGMDPAEMMKKVEAAGTPGEAHKVLEPRIGEWTAEVKSWMAPGQPPVVSQGSAMSQWVMNGRFVQEEFHGEMMGKPFTGMSLTGYDNMKQKYVSIWIDDVSTSIFVSEGTAEDDGKVITFSGKMDCPFTSEKDIPVKHVLRILGPDKQVFEMYDPRMGENTKAMEITYTRK